MEKIELVSDIQERDANEIVAALLSTGIEAEKEKGKKSLSVIINKKDMAIAVETLNAKGLPNRHHSSLGEVFKKEGMVSTPLEERARYIYALSQELEYTISQIDYVLIARVHIVLPERIAPGQPIQPPSAAIFIKHLPGLDPDAVGPKVKRVVTSSIPGLKGESLDKISVSFMLSVKEQPKVKMVKVGKYLLTEDSAKALRKTIATVVSVAALLVVGVLGFLFFRFKFKKKAEKNPAEPEVKKQTDDDTDFFTGDEIIP